MAEKKFEWLTEEICKEYMARAAKLTPNGGNDTGAWRALRKELQERCNLTEVEAVNILHGHNLKAYLQKYGVLSGKLPKTEAMIEQELKAERKKSRDEKLQEYREKIEMLESLKNGYGARSGFDLEEAEDENV